MTNKEWLKKLPQKFYDMYYGYALMCVCQGDFEQFNKWLEETCSFEKEQMVKKEEKKKHDKHSKDSTEDNK